jgi:hypothetical protein
MAAPGARTTCSGRPVSACGGVGNSGASRHALTGYTSATSASSKSQVQDGSAAGPDRRSESGKPAAITMRRHGVAASTLATAPASAASAAPHAGASPASSISR